MKRDGGRWRSPDSEVGASSGDAVGAWRLFIAPYIIQLKFAKDLEAECFTIHRKSHGGTSNHFSVYQA